MKTHRKYFSAAILIAVFQLFNLTYANNAKNNETSDTITYEGAQITKEGAWCWFADPRSLHFQNKQGTINSTYIAYIDVHGNIKATQYNFLTGKTNEVLIRSWFQPDDHNIPTFLVLPDERIMIFYSRHTDEPRFYYRISKKPGDITDLGNEKIIETGANTTYPNPFILSDDPNHMYLCWRGINWHPTIAKLSLPDANDDVSISEGPFQIVQSTGARPYAKYFSNRKDKIYLAYTTGHPDNEYPNWIYFSYIDVNNFQLKDINGKVLSSISDSVFNINKTSMFASTFPATVVDSPEDQRDWIWQISSEKDGFPIIAMVRISDDKTAHRYYYAKWTGSEWRKTFITNTGEKFHQTNGVELCYSSGMAIDNANPNTFYCSVPKKGKYGNIYEIMKYDFDANGTVSDSTQITKNSTLNNVRPFLIENSENTPLRLTWMHGNYYYWITNAAYPLGFPTDIRSNWALPQDNINLADGLLINKNFEGNTNGSATKITSFSLTRSNAFSISLTLNIDVDKHDETIFTMKNLSYGVTSSKTPKPYIKIGSETYTSQNVLGTSDNYWSQPVLSGVWRIPAKLGFFNLTLTYENETLTVYRNGLIDQIISDLNLTLSNFKMGGFHGFIKNCRIYNRVLTQSEVKKIVEKGAN